MMEPTQLYQLKSPKNAILSDFVSNINNLVTNSFSNKVKLDTKKNNILWRSLPSKAQYIARKKFGYFRYINNGKYPSFKEYAEMLINDDRIEKDIILNGENPHGFYSCDRNKCGIMFPNDIKMHISKATGELYPIYSRIECFDRYIIYSIECKKCDKQYVGRTSQPIHTRLEQHYRGVQNGVAGSIPEHFGKPNHSISDMVFTPFEKIPGNNYELLKRRESYWIRTKDTFNKGMNKFQC